MIDIHSHIINSIDDGAKSQEMTIEMLKLAAKKGTTKIVATPHYMRGRFNEEYKDVVKATEKLKLIAKENNINIEIYCGQEVYYSENLIKYYSLGMIGTINDSRYMLIELPMVEFNVQEVINSIYELQIKGVVPILAHPERYVPFIKKPSLINKFIEEGYLFQLNVGSLKGGFGKKVKKTAELYMDNRIYNFVGSDAHRLEFRNTDMSYLVNNIDSHIIREFEKDSEQLLMDENVEFCGKKVKERRSFFGIFK